MEIESVAGIAVVSADPAESRKLYVDALGLPLEAGPGDDYLHSEKVAGTNHFGVWPLAQAARACFGQDEWPEGTAVPQSSVEFEVASAEAVADAGRELETAGFALLHEAREEPWGQIVARVLSPEGVIVGISFVPWMH